jgi:hypothetical protein
MPLIPMSCENGGRLLGRDGMESMNSRHGLLDV